MLRQSMKERVSLDTVNKLLKNREKPKSIRLSGGAANSRVWVQIFADALQIPVDVIADKELGARARLWRQA